jgi:hypothetical protein
MPRRLTGGDVQTSLFKTSPDKQQQQQQCQHNLYLNISGEFAVLLPIVSQTIGLPYICYSTRRKRHVTCAGIRIGSVG